MKNNSWVKIYRSFLEWEWYDDTNTKILFLHILLKANFKTKNWRGEEIKRGSFITSLENLSKQTGLSIMQVRTSISKLISTSEITKQSSSQYTVITVNNYETYQGVTSKATNEQQTDNKRVTTTKEREERKERKKKNSSIKVLRDSEFWEELSLKFNTNRSYIEQECEKMEDWLKAKGKRQSDYKAFARNWVRRATESQRKEYEVGRVEVDRGLQSTQELLDQYRK